MKLISCIIICTTLIVGNHASIKYTDNPQPFSDPSNATEKTTLKTNSSTPQSTGAQTANPHANANSKSMSTHGRPIDTKNPNNESSRNEKLQSLSSDVESIGIRNMTNGIKDDGISSGNLTAQNAAALRSISIHVENTAAIIKSTAKMVIIAVQFVFLLRDTILR